MKTETYFSREEIERARRYHRPLYRYLLLREGFGLVYLSVVAFTLVRGWLAAPVDDLPFWVFGLAYPALIVLVGAVLRLPLSLWRYRYERRWEFSTQRLPGWLADWAKGLAIGVVLSGVAVLGLVELAAAQPRLWPVSAALGAAVLTLLLSLIAPVVLEPLFNRFRPLEDGTLAADLLSLADRAGVAVRRVLISDASRRTRKENAYVSGLGRTRRVVVFDTLLSRGGAREVRLVVAHELGHWRDRHVAKGTALSAAAAAAGVVLLWLLLRSGAVLDVIGASGAADPRVAPFLFLLGDVAGLVTLPIGNAISRRWEADADRTSIELTGDVDGFVEMERNLAVSNLLDLSPGRLSYLLLFSHPSPPERIAAALRDRDPTTA